MHWHCICSAMCEKQIVIPNTTILYCSERYNLSPSTFCPASYTQRLTKLLLLVVDVKMPSSMTLIRPSPSWAITLPCLPTIRNNQASQFVQLSLADCQIHVRWTLGYRPQPMMAKPTWIQLSGSRPIQIGLRESRRVGKPSLGNQSSYIVQAARHTVISLDFIVQHRQAHVHYGVPQACLIHPIPQQALLKAWLGRHPGLWCLLWALSRIPR